MISEREQWWIFTFGWGQPHAGYYVRIYGTYGEARKEMFRRYGRRWAFQYSEEEWNELQDKEPYIDFEVELREDDDC